MVSVAFCKTNGGMRINVWIDGHFLYLCQLKANTNVMEALVCQFPFADISPLAAYCEDDVLLLAGSFSMVLKTAKLTINIQRTLVLQQAAP